MKKRGISLIVLIVTIIVIIILAAVVILTISKNNPIESATEATFKEDVRTFQDELAMYISKDYTNKAGARDNKITETDSSKIKDYIPSFSKKYDGKFVIKNDELMYNENITTQEKEWCQSLNVKENAKTGAEKAKEFPSEYYGKKIAYTTGNSNIDDYIKEWKIFYSDGNNLYIIPSEYISLADFPIKDNVKPDQADAINNPKGVRFNNILSKYKGSPNIIDQKLKDFNHEYFEKNFVSEKENMKSVAYMLDKEIWSIFANPLFSDYAVGGPSIEMLMKSYSQKNNVDYRAEAFTNTGYRISDNGEKNYQYIIYSMLNTSDDLYVLPKSKGAEAMWLSSPSAGNATYVLKVKYDGYVGHDDYRHSYTGFRPLVCLRTNITITWDSQNKIFKFE